jgi:hypothetical protein
MIELVICLGKQLNDDGSLDWISQERVKLAVTIVNENPNAKLLLSGGKKYSDERSLEVSEAKAMETYIKNELNRNDLQIIIEDEGPSSLTQLVIIKTKIILPQQIKNIALVTDEVHLERARTLFDAIMGDEYQINYQGSLVDIAGQYRDLIVQNEAIKTKYIIDNMINQLPKGDHEAYRKYDEEYRAAQLEHNKSGGDPNQPVNMRILKSA